MMHPWESAGESGERGLALACRYQNPGKEPIPVGAVVGEVSMEWSRCISPDEFDFLLLTDEAIAIEFVNRSRRVRQRHRSPP